MVTSGLPVVYMLILTNEKLMMRLRDINFLYQFVFVGYYFLVYSSVYL